jgi:hypothetical protein
MKKNLLKQYWADSVWSKVIAVGIVGLISSIWIEVNSVICNISFLMYVQNILYSSIQVKNILIGLLVIMVIWYGINMARKKKKIVEVYSEEHKQLDKELFSKIITEILPVSGFISFIRTNNFEGAFRTEYIKDLDSFYQYIEEPDFEFIDRDLNIYLEQLKVEISKFQNTIGLNTSPINNPNMDANSVPPEWEVEQPEKFWKVVNEIHKTAREICKNYDGLIKLGKRKLGI